MKQKPVKKRFLIANKLFVGSKSNQQLVSSSKIRQLVFYIIITSFDSFAALVANQRFQFQHHGQVYILSMLFNMKL